MSCISEILKIKGDKEALILRNDSGIPRVSIEGGGEYYGYDYLIVLTTFGHRCGYVAIPPTHKYHSFLENKSTLKKHKKELYDYLDDIECHGGITFASQQNEIKDQLLSHVCVDFWIGFDCSHTKDLPDKEALFKYFEIEKDLYIDVFYSDIEKWKSFGCEIRDYNFVKKECEHIIDQLIEKAA